MVMKKLALILMALTTLAACSKNNEPDNPNIDKLVPDIWHAFTGETYDVEEFMTVGGASISLGVRTKELASGFSFSKNGTGKRFVTYYAQKGMVTKYPYDYAEIDFTWKIDGDLITITNVTKDSIIPDTCTIEIVAFYSDRFSGKYNGKSMSFLGGVAWIDYISK